MRTQTPVQRRRPLSILNRDPVLIILAALAAVALATTITRPPTTVPNLTIRNGTAWHLDLSMGDGTSASRSDLPVVLADSTNRLTDVLDQGDRWVFDVRSGGIDAGTIVVSRDDLDDDWTLVIPDSVSQKLDAAGAPLPAD